MPDSDEPQTLESGQTFAHYRIAERLGAGGMGEVYLATDTKLGRKVALKILPFSTTRSPDTILRFEQEARAASALNHPNIAHIYEIGECDGLHFIAMEFVEGVSLSDKVAGQPLPISEIVRLGIQIADALDEAHSQSVVHRDIKSANVMLDRRDRVKVLDFGLAKISQQVESEESTRLKTRSGVIMGTVSYMSPEQALGRETDARSDIWSLGVVLYEMATGRLPFQAESMTATIEKIVHSQPEAVARFNYDVPPELELIIKKALRKDRDERYRSAHDVLVDLRSLGHELNLADSISTPDAKIERRLRSPDGNKTDEHAAATLVIDHDTEKGAVHTTSSAEYIVGEIRRHRTAALTFSVFGLFILAVLGYGLYRILSAPEAAGPPQTKQNDTTAVKTQRMTGDGTTTEAAISPDGRFLAYEKAEGGKRSLWIKQISTNSNVQIVEPDTLGDFDFLTFTPDGNFVYFNSDESPSSALYRVPTLGGSVTKIQTDVYAPTFSPDGGQMAYLRYSPATTETSLMVANADGTGERRLAQRSVNQWFDTALAWSPDGKLIAAATGDDLRPDHWNGVSVVSVSDGVLVDVGKPEWENISGIVWRPDMSALLINGYEKAGTPAKLWEISYPEAKTRMLMHGRSNSHGLAITADGKSLVLIEEEANSGIWVSPNADIKNAAQITPGKGDTWGISWTPDKRLVYIADTSGNPELWIINDDGTSQKQLTNDARVKTEPVVSPDGRYIVYSSGLHIWRINIDGSNAVQLTNGTDENNPDISPNGKWVVFSAWTGSRLTLWRVPLEGGEAEKISDVLATEPRLSPDGKMIACFLMAENTGTIKQIGIIQFDSGDLLKTFDVPLNPNATVSPVWTPDGRGITYVERQGLGTKLWMQPLDGGPSKVLSDDKQHGIYRREWTRDGKQVAVTRGDLTSNAVMVTGF